MSGRSPSVRSDLRSYTPQRYTAAYGNFYFGMAADSMDSSLKGVGNGRISYMATFGNLDL